MGIVYDKSISSKYKKYFEQIPDLIKPFQEYSLGDKKVISRQAKNAKPWESGQAGIPLAWSKNDGKVNVDHTDSHTLVIGPTGSKKSRLIAMPLVRILGSAKESMIISDPKAEIFNRTASYLEEQNYKVFVLNLRSPQHGNCWNPLAIPYEFFCKGETDRACEFVNDIAENLIQSGKSQSEPFWDNSAGSLFFGLVLLLFKYCKEFNKEKDYVHIGNVICLRNALLPKNRGRSRDWLWKYAQTDSIISSALIGTVETADDTRAGILSVFDQKVRMFLIQPNLMDMLSTNEIDFDIIGNKPVAIYLIVPDEKTGYHGLVSLFIKQSYEYMIYGAQIPNDVAGLQVGSLKNRVNYILDEFSSLPTITDFPAMMTASRSRNIRFTLIIQSKHQLIQRYKEEAETIQTNCNNWVFLTSRELKLLEELSAICGKVDASKSVLSVSMLQRLNKDEGEALLLCGRSKPCVTKLPDIDLYDDHQFDTATILLRQMRIPKTLNFENPISNNKLENEERRKPFFMDQQNIDVDSLMKDIDLKIAELEQQELVQGQRETTKK